MRSSFALLLILLAGCQRGSAPEAAPVADLDPPAVKLVRPQKKTVRRVINQPGHNVEAYQHAPLYAKITGYVAKLNVDIGDAVKEGQELLVLNAPELDAELKQKEAGVTQSQAEVQQAEKALAAAEASIKSAKAMVKQTEAGRATVKAEQTRANSQLTRMSKAGKGGVVDREAVEEVRYTARAADAMVLEAEAKVLSAKAGADEAAARRDKAAADVSVKKALVEVAKATRDQARSMRDYRFIKAPFSGVVTARNTDVGHFVQPPGQGKGGALLSIDRKDRMRLFVNLPELDARFIEDTTTKKLSPKVEIRSQGLGGKILRGEVTRSAFALDPRSRTLRTEIELPNKHGLLRPGQYVHVRITLEHAATWTVPASAVVQHDADIYCFTVKGGKVRKVPVEIGLQGGGLVELRSIQSGKEEWSALAGREEVILNPPAGLKDGDAVAIR